MSYRIITADLFARIEQAEHGALRVTMELNPGEHHSTNRSAALAYARESLCSDSYVIGAYVGKSHYRRTDGYSATANVFSIVAPGFSVPNEADYTTATDSAVDTLLWTEAADDGEPGEHLDAAHDRDDFAPHCRTELRADVRSFYLLNAHDLDGIDAAQVGHDFILTRNRHGAGFWDRGLGDRGTRLTEAAHAYGELSAYVGDDGKVYAS